MGQFSRVTSIDLATEFEKALARGEDTVVAEFVLTELRKLVRRPDATDMPRIDDLQRVAFATLEPFLVNGEDTRPGQPGRAGSPYHSVG